MNIRLKPRLVGRLLWEVPSESRDELVHYVDFEPNIYTLFRRVRGTNQLESREYQEPTTCTCEAFEIQKHRPCKHQRKVIRAMVDSLPLTGEQREEMTEKLEALCRQSPHYMPRIENFEPEKPAPSFKTKRYILDPETSARLAANLRA